MLEGIERSFIEKTVEDAEVTKKEASELKEKHLEEMNTLKDLKMQMLEKMKEETEIERKKQLAEAKKEATEIIEKEKAIFYAEKRRYETELKDKAIDTVSIFASNLLKDISDEELHRCIYRKLLDELGQIASEIARIREKEKTLTIDLYLFTAYQLNEEELRKFQNAIESSISQEVALNTTVDNSLIAGMRIKAYDMVYDYSLSGPIDTLKLRLKETT